MSAAAASMRRFVPTAVIVLTAAAAIPATAGAALPRATLRSLVCQHALDPQARAIAITAVMRPIPGTVRMSLRIELTARLRGTGSYMTISGGDLGTWITPGNPTLGQRSRDVWILNKQVIDLVAPAWYRFKVFFRWTGARRHLLGTAVRTSARCFQPELRPDLLVQSIAVQPIVGRPDQDRYAVTVRNASANYAGPFQVLFVPGAGLPVKTRTLPGLRAHHSVVESFVGPLCSKSRPTVTVDPNGLVDDSDRANNQLSAVCPAQ